MNTLPLTHSPVSFPAVFNVFENVVAFIRKELVAYAAVRKLREMDDRALADIGLTRANIVEAVRGQKTAQ